MSADAKDVELVAHEGDSAKKTTRDIEDGSITGIEIYDKSKYKALKVRYTKTTGEVVDYNVGSWLSCQDIGIICACFMMLWSCLLGIYVLLLKAALDTDEKSTALWIYFVFGVIFVIFVAGAVFMNKVEKELDAKYNPPKGKEIV